MLYTSHLYYTCNIRAVQKTAIFIYSYAHLHWGTLLRKNNARETRSFYYDI